MHDPRGTGYLYFSERIQTAVFDNILHQFAPLYYAVRQWLHGRLQEELYGYNRGIGYTDTAMHEVDSTACVLEQGGNSRESAINALPLQELSSPTPLIPDPYALHMPLPCY